MQQGGKGKCSKGFPQPYSNYTYFDKKGFAHYKRPKDGQILVLNGNVIVDNQWVVPYNPYVLSKYQNHTNVERVCGLSVFKYIFYYMYKGTDTLYAKLREQIRKNWPDVNFDGNEGIDLDGELFENDIFENNEPEIGIREMEPQRQAPVVEVDFDEISMFEQYRVLTPQEAFFRDAGFPTSYLTYRCIPLAVHEEGKGRVTFEEGKAAEAAEQAAKREANTKFEAWFVLNRLCEEARQYTFNEIPKKFRFDKSAMKWVKRKREQMILGRICKLAPKFREKFAIRELARTVKGPQRFEDLRTVNNIVYKTYAVKDPRDLWETFKESMVDRRTHRTDEYLEYAALENINTILKTSHGVGLHTFDIAVPQTVPEPVDPTK